MSQAEYASLKTCVRAIAFCGALLHRVISSGGRVSFDSMCIVGSGASQSGKADHHHLGQEGTEPHLPQSLQAARLAAAVYKLYTLNPEP